MKKVTVIAILAVFLIFAKFSFSQSVGINTATPTSSAALEINSNAGGYQGILIPQVPLGSRLVSSSAITNAMTGLLVYNTTFNTTAGLVPGFYFCVGTPGQVGTAWQELISSDRIYGFAAYGELFESKNFNQGTLYTLPEDTWVPWNSATAGLCDNVSYVINGSDYLVIDGEQSGAYQVSLSTSFQGENSMQIIVQAFIIRSGVTIPVSKIQIHSKLMANGDLVSGAASGVVNFQAGDQLLVQFMCENATKTINLELLNISIAKISDTFVTE